MITCRFLGRLGNSMFQIAATISYARRYGCDWAVMPDDSGRPWESGVLNAFPNLPKFNPPYRLPYYNEHPATNCPVHGVHYDICHYDYHEIPNQGDNRCLLGFFQSYKYFENVQDEVKKVFALAHVPGYEDYVSIHWRLGDYVQHSASFPPITMDYLFQAHQEIIARTGINKHKYMVFSDDIPYCKNEIGRIWGDFEGRIEYSEGRGELQDLSLMASCGHHIIANSSYSWWGSYLGHNPDKIIVCPSVKRGSWYGMNSGIKKDCVDLVPPNWIQIEFR